ncbi:MAG: YolD-like family protein [Dethiobacter sp.]|nr:YolD-like family protein [Dethiobacter sp.]
MKTHNFSASRIILPQHRQDFLSQKQKALQTESLKRPILDCQRLFEFQCLLEKSLHDGLVLRIVALVQSGRMNTTGIVKQIDLYRGQIDVETLEGLRTLTASDIIDILG